MNKNSLLESFDNNEYLFDKISNDIYTTGYSINENAMPVELLGELVEYLDSLNKAKFKSAKIGRNKQQKLMKVVRSDEIYWMTGKAEQEKSWVLWAENLQAYLNRRLFLGLFSFESHFAHYSTGDFYKRHYDAFKGEANRVLSVVVYLNPERDEKDGGELVIYLNDADREGIKIIPTLGTLVVFLSEDFAHEVLPTCVDRYSIAGWFRVSASTSDRVDPPT